MTQRDLDDYVVKYDELLFERTAEAFRRRRTLERITAHKPRTLLEVGCGRSPLFTDLPDTAVTVLEPAAQFAEEATRLTADRPDVVIVRQPVEEAPAELLNGPFDMVVIGCLLHEVPRPDVLLRSVQRWCHRGSVVHINVPNAGSLHRRLGVAMRVLDSVDGLTETQLLMQQHRTYDLPTLDDELRRSGLRQVGAGGILVKPFSHAQMQRLVEMSFLTDEVLQGLDALADREPEIASEIWVDAVFDDA